MDLQKVPRDLDLFGMQIRSRSKIFETIDETSQVFFHMETELLTLNYCSEIFILFLID
jgi:hypothetical protein